MSHVYRAVDTVIGRTVAVKILTEAATEDEEAKARFLAEARTAGNLHHENVIRIYDLGEAEGLRFITMEFIEGESFAGMIGRRGPVVAPAQAAHLAVLAHAALP